MTVQHQSYLELKNRERFFPRRIPKDIKSRLKRFSFVSPLATPSQD